MTALGVTSTNYRLKQGSLSLAGRRQIAGASGGGGSAGERELGNDAIKGKSIEDSKDKASPAVSASTITEAYEANVSFSDLRMSIADLKDHLGIQDNAEVHATLQRMQQAGRVSLRGVEDPTEITPRIRAASIDFGPDSQSFAGRDLRPFFIVR